MATLDGVCRVLKGILATNFEAAENVIPHVDDMKIGKAIKRAILLKIEASKVARKKIADSLKKPDEIIIQDGEKSEENRKNDEEEKKKLEEEKQRLKLEEKKKQDEEKQKKLEERKKQQEEEKLKRFEEKKKKQEEEKQKKQDAKQKEMEARQKEMLEKRRKEEKVSEGFRKFFVKSSPTSSPITPKVVIASSVDRPRFLPFQLKPNQTLTPVVASFVRDNFQVGCFDSDVCSQEEPVDNLYIQLLKSQHITPHRTGRKIRSNQDTDILVDEVVPGKKRYIGKLLQFHDNVRPAWFGTWSKKSSKVTGRRPFAQDVDCNINYEVESDEEWDEGGPGESLSGSDGEKSDPEDDYVIDNEFMVPHGYLSGSEEEDQIKDGDGAGNDASTFREKEMLARKKLRVKPLKSVSIGCVWKRDMMDHGQIVPAHEVLKKWRVVFNCKSSRDSGGHFSPPMSQATPNPENPTLEQTEEEDFEGENLIEGSKTTPTIEMMQEEEEEEIERNEEIEDEIEKEEEMEEEEQKELETVQTTEQLVA